MGTPLLSRRPARAFPTIAALAAIAAIAFGCQPETTGPGIPDQGPFRIRPVLVSSVDPALLDLDSVAVTIRRSSDGGSVTDAVLAYEENAILAWVLSLEDLPDVLDVDVQVRSGSMPMFEGSLEDVDIEEASPATSGPIHEVPLEFVGPGSDAAAVTVEPEDSVVMFGETVAFRAVVTNASGDVIPGAIVVWESSAPGLAPVDAAGVLTAPSTRGSVEVTARTVGGASGATGVRFQPLVAELAVLAGDGVTAPVAETVTITVQVLGDDGLGVEDVDVSFMAPQGAAVSEAVVTSGPDGTASTLATLGTLPGAYAFKASVAGPSPVTLTVEAEPGPPAALAIDLNGSSAAPAEVIAPGVTVRAADAYGNDTSEPLVVTVALGINPVGAVLSGTTLQVSGSGVATFTDLVVDRHGVGFTLVASAAGLTPVTSAAFDVLQTLRTIQVTASSGQLSALAATEALAAVGLDGAGAPIVGQTFAWASSDESVATVDASGVVTAMANGTVQITASAAGVSGVVSVEVAQVADRVLVTPTEDELAALGAQVQLTAQVVDANGFAVAAGPSVTWASSASALVTVDASGLVTAVQNGSAEIEATSAGVIGSATITVSQAVASVEVDPPTSTLESLQARTQLDASAYDANGYRVAGASFVWSAPAGGAASVDAVGLTTAESNGVTTVTATSGTVFGTADVTVSQTIASVVVDPPTSMLAALQSQTQLDASAYDANGYVIAGASFTWTSSDAGVASVSTAGVVTAESNGPADITAAAGGLSASADVTVSQVATAVVVTPGDVALDALAATAQLTAEVVDANGYTVGGASVVWSAPAGGAASVNAAGLVTAESNGVATVTATSGSVFGSADVTVSQVVASVVVDPPTSTLAALQAQTQLAASAYDANGFAVAGASFTWTSSDAGVAAVSATGLVTAESNGPAEITATAAGLFASANVTVSQVATAVVVTPGDVELGALAATAQLTAEVVDANGFPLAAAPIVTWSAPVGGAASVDAAGLVTAESNGLTTVTATSGSVFGIANVTVAQRVALLTLSISCPGDGSSAAPSGPLRSIPVESQCDTLLAFGDQALIIADAIDANGFVVASPAIAWSSLQPLVASVDGNGLVTGVDNGTAVIRAESDGVVEEIDVVVRQLVVSLSVEPEHLELAVGALGQLTAIPLDANGYLVVDATMTWTTPHDLVAAVDDSGLVLALAPGEVVVYATHAELTAEASVVVE